MKKAKINENHPPAHGLYRGMAWLCGAATLVSAAVFLAAFFYGGIRLVFSWGVVSVTRPIRPLLFALVSGLLYVRMDHRISPERFRRRVTRMTKRMARWEPYLLALLLTGVLALHLFPLFRYEIIPTQDGPAHVENAWILKTLVMESGSSHAAVYEINRRPVPNWFGHAFMAIGMIWACPFLVEKILIAFYVLLFWFAFWFLLRGIGKDRLASLFLVGPFVYTYTFHMGFYNFCISIPLGILLIAVWLRWQERLTLNRLIGLNLMALLLYSAHFVSFTLTLICIGIATLRFEKGILARSIKRLYGLAPAYGLFTWYFFLGSPRGAANHWGWGRLWRYLARSGSLTSYMPIQDQYGVTFFRFMMMLAVISFAVRFYERLRHRAPMCRREDLFLGMTLIALAAYFAAPGRMSGGGYVSERLMLFPLLFLIPWLNVRWSTARLCMAAIAVYFTVLYSRTTLQAYDKVVPRLVEYRRQAETMRPGATYLPLNGGAERSVPQTIRIFPFMHAAGYRAVRAGVVNLRNYEANTGYFPVSYRPGKNPDDVLPGLFHGNQRTLPYYEYSDEIEYISYRHHGPEEPVLSHLEEHYEPVSENRFLTLYRRKATP